MLGLKGSELSLVPLHELAGRMRLVPLDHPLIQSARRVGTSFGD
jgi:6-phosphofructokinase 1